MAKRKHDIDDIIKALNEYIDKTDNPLIIEFCVNYKISKSYLYDLASRYTRDDISEDEKSKYIALSDAIKRAVLKSEVYIIKSASAGAMPYALAIFLLKQPQHGYTDRQDIATDTQITVNFNIPRPSASPLPTVDITPKLGGKRHQNK
jgi:hypothetical protein